MAITDKGLLNILQTHGQKFLDSFAAPEDNKNRRKRTTRGSSESGRAAKLAKRETATRSSPVDCPDSAEEWTGFGTDTRIEADEWESHSLIGEVTPLEGGLAPSQ
jgi:hypothetical protein